MIPRRLRPALFLGLGAGVLAAAGAPCCAAAPRAAGLAWSARLAAGFDTFVQSYPLAETDTTETIAEYEIVLSAEGVTPGRGRHLWRLRPRLSMGTELARGDVEAGYRYRPDSTRAVLRLDARLRGRDYRGGTDYSLNSDNGELELRGAWTLAPAGRLAAELRTRARRLRHAAPSELEVDRDEAGGGVYLVSGRDLPWRFRAGGGWTRRCHPDTAALDRTVWSLEGEADLGGLGPRSLRLYHRSDRRRVRDETARPSAWAHWSDLAAALPLAATGGPALELDLQHETWRYDAERDPYVDSTRLSARLGLRGGGVTGPVWRAGLAGEILRAGDAPETYSQFGVRAGLESFGEKLIAAFTMEVGRRDYSGTASTPSASVVDDLFQDLDVYSDFTYVELWLLATWSLGPRLDLDLAANYQPENHVEEFDDTALGYGSARLVWRF